MRIKVLYFGVLKDIFRASEQTVELPEALTAGQALSLLWERTSNESRPLRSLAIAVNRVYAPAATVLHEGDEMALLPPVSGGRPEGVHAR